MALSRNPDRPLTPFDFGYDKDQGSPLKDGAFSYCTVADYVAIYEKNEMVEQSELDTIYPDTAAKERIIWDALVSASDYINSYLAGCGISPLPAIGCQPILRRATAALARRMREVYGLRENVEADYQIFCVQVLEQICAGKLKLAGSSTPVIQVEGKQPPYSLAGQRCGYVPFRN